MPKGAFEWHLHCSTRMDGYAPYPSYEAAECGENAMKDYLGKHGRWLGGEFYTIDLDHFKKAWILGRQAATDFDDIED